MKFATHDDGALDGDQGAAKTRSMKFGDWVGMQTRAPGAGDGPFGRSGRISPTTRSALLTCVLGLPFGATQAETLRCPGGIVAEGDSRLSLVYKCGQPQLADSFCASVFYGPWPNPVPEPFASAVLPCQLTEQWLYERGQGNLVATVTLRAGKVQSITYGRTPQ